MAHGLALAVRMQHAHGLLLLPCNVGAHASCNWLTAYAPNMQTRTHTRRRHNAPVAIKYVIVDHLAPGATEAVLGPALTHPNVLQVIYIYRGVVWVGQKVPQKESSRKEAQQGVCSAGSVLQAGQSARVRRGVLFGMGVGAGVAGACRAAGPTARPNSRVDEAWVATWRDADGALGKEAEGRGARSCQLTPVPLTKGPSLPPCCHRCPCPADV